METCSPRTLLHNRYIRLGLREIMYRHAKNCKKWDSAILKQKWILNIVSVKAGPVGSPQRFRSQTFLTNRST
jgi:hypothetical protein